MNWHYEVEGTGEPILFIHGFGGSGLWWSMQREAFARHHQLIIVDLPGHGKSEWMPIGLRDIAIDLLQIVGTHNIAQLNVVAASLGGLVALEMDRAAPGRLMRMSFVGCIPKFARGPDYPAGLDIDKIRKLSGQFDGDYGGMLEIFFRSLFTMKERDSGQFKQVREMRSQEQLPKREALKAFLDILEKTDLRDRLSSVICPQQFITGAEDYICPRPVMDWVAEHAYNARFDFLEGCGHLPFLTDVKEYNRLLEDFLLS